MTLSADESALWQRLTDHPQPEELPAYGLPLRWFSVPAADNRWPAQVAALRLLPGSPPRLLRHWTASLLSELTGVCPYCHAERGDLPTLSHWPPCELRNYGSRARGWLVPGSIDAIAALYGPAVADS